MLSKYDRLSDHFHDLQTTLQTEFSLLKKATSKNIENLQEAINLQQTYTTSLCSDVNSIYAKLQSQPIPDSTNHSVYQDTEQPREEYPNHYKPQLEDIPELEDDKENWEEGQFVDADFIDYHSTTGGSDRICHKYSAHFKKVTDQGYSSQNNRMPGFEYYIPEPEYYNLDT